ncbi:MAG TPA: hypothetical protein VLI54_01860 [Bacillota bacterium]|nr:hypothetical protein [Bacillota bacterium]
MEQLPKLWTPQSDPTRIVEPVYLTPAEHDELKARTAQDLARLQATAVFKLAIRPSDPYADIEVFYAPPTPSTLEGLQWQEGERTFIKRWFAKKDGDDPDVMDAEMSPYAANDHGLLVVRHFPFQDKPSRPISALRVVGPVAGRTAHSLLALDSEWGLDVNEVLAATTFPDGERLPADFLEHAWDITHVSMDPQEADVRAIMATYNAALKIIAKHGGRFILGTMDVKLVFNQLYSRGNQDWVKAAGVWDKPVLTRVKDSNVSTLGIGRVPPWRDRLHRTQPRLGELMFGDTLERDRRVVFTGFDLPRKPLYDTLPPNPRLSPEHLYARGERTPYLMLDLNAAGDRLRRFEESLPGVDVHYAVKVQPDAGLLRYLHGEGAGFEIASAAELRRLRRVGVQPRDVLYSNPVKPPQHIEKAHQAGVYRFAIDSQQELEKVAAYAPGASVYVRLKTEALHSKVGSEGKFGVDNDTAEGLLRMAGSYGLRAYGIAFHVGSQVKRPELWQRAIRQSGELMERLGRTGLLDSNGAPIRIQMLNMGGGFPAHHEQIYPRIEEVAGVINRSLERDLPYLPRKLAIEPGRALVAEAGMIGATVLAVVQRGATRFVHLDLGFTLFEAVESGFTIDYPITDSRRTSTRSTSTIVAATCDGQDTIVKNDNSLSADLQPGDVVYIGATGAYSNYGKTFNGIPELTVHHAIPQPIVSRMGRRLCSATEVLLDSPDGRVVAHSPLGYGSWPTNSLWNDRLD